MKAPDLTMFGKKSEDLGKTLLRMRLLEPDQLAQVLKGLGGKAKDDALLTALEDKHLLTPYQINRIKDGEVDGLVLGDYKLMYMNASGSFARVFRACSVTNGEMVGLKLLRNRWVENPKMVTSFHREADLCQRLKHKNIVPIYQVGQRDKYHWFTMEFVEGGNFRDFLNIRKKLSAAEATQYILDIAEGLEYALKVGMTHRDLKMTNILMSIQGVAKLVDFGLAGDDGISGSTSTGDGVQRALEYATLEQATNAPDNDPRSDLFFLGTIYYELLTGQAPYERTRSREERKRVDRYQHIPSLRSVDPNIHRPVEKIVEKLLQWNPNERFQSATELIAELIELQRYLGVTSDHGLKAIPADNEDLKPDTSDTPTVMFIENREAQQDQLRTHIGKKGLRVLMLSDVDRAMKRLMTDPPDCVVLMGGAIGDGISDAYKKTVRWGKESPVACLAVLSKKQAELKQSLPDTPLSKVIVQPISLRDLRGEIKLLIEKKKARESA